MSRGRTLEHIRRGIEHEAAVGSGIYRILSPADTRSTVNSAFVSIRTVCRFVAPASCSNERSSTGATYSLPNDLAIVENEDERAAVIDTGARILGFAKADYNRWDIAPSNEPF